MRIAVLALLTLACLTGARADAQAQGDMPPTLLELQAIEPEIRQGEDENTMPLDIRRDAMREAAHSFGARGGLATRTWEIKRELEQRAPYLDKVFDFRQLLIPAQSGLLIEPPVISEALDAMHIESGGLSAAVSDSVYNIGRNARIVSTSRTWRQYLEREWDAVDPPPDILRPQNKEERASWNRWTASGWEQGIQQANDIFQEDLNRLTADYRGMVRYRMLLAQGMVSQPYALQIDRGVTGGGNEMRVGDRALSITGLPSLKTDTSQWQPANR